LKCFSLGVTAEALRARYRFKSAISLQRGPVDPKFQVEGVAPTNHFSSQKTRLNGLSYAIKNWTFCYDARVWQTDGWTNRHISHRYSPRWHSMQRGKKCIDTWERVGLRQPLYDFSKINAVYGSFKHYDRCL